MIPLPEYWQAVAQGIDAEERKASLFIKHNVSVGAAREEILRDFLRKHTPEPYRARSGFIHQLDQNRERSYCSPQLDVVVYNPAIAQPDYQIGELVVVPRRPATLTAEVKTDLDKKEWERMMGNWNGADGIAANGIAWLNLPHFGFAYDGWKFSTFVDYLSKAIASSTWGVPHCIAVHSQNYIFVRSHYGRNPTRPSRRRAAEHHFAVNFGTAPDSRGLATGQLLDFYLQRLRNHVDFDHLARWFTAIDLPSDDKIQFSDEGDVLNANAANGQ